ncbi:retrovirus-related pol polyprotein from transposon TNT 1-94 [Tanacetum coccineum]
MDSGCSYHMTHRLDILFDFLECDGGSVLLGDNRECKIRVIGKVRVQLRDGLSFVLNNVKYIPELKRNLISLGILEKERYTVKLQSGKVKVINGSRVVLSRTRRDNCIYSLDGHGSGRRVWVYILRFKHKAFGKFKEWKQLVENQTGRTVKKLRMDNGLEFCNREFEQLCIESKIPRHLTVVGIPQQNGSPSTTIEKKTPMEMWSGHPSDYRMLRIFSCVAYSHVKQGNDKSVEELHVEVELQRLNNHMLEEDQTNQDDGDDEDVGDQETDQTPDLTDYQLTQDLESQGQECNH